MVLILCSLVALVEGRAAELTIESALTQRVIAPDRPLQEVQAFTESRILPMPEFRDVSEWEAWSNRTRRAVFEKVIFRGEAADWREQPTRIEWLETLDVGSEYRIRKLRYEAVPGMWVPALLYEPLQIKGRIPVVMNVNGHDRTNGKAADYKQIRCINQVKRGMLALNVEWLGMGQLNTPGFSHYSMNQLNLCGTSGLAPFYLTMSRGLDVLLQHAHADKNRVAVAGLSGGGWQTIVISSLDTRVTLCNPVAGYSSLRTRVRNFGDLGDSEQTPCDFARVTDYAQLTALLAPRPALITKNAEDSCCFRAEHALPPLLQAARPIYDLYGKASSLRYHINHDPGDHNFGLDNRQQFYRMLGEFFFPNDPEFRSDEFNCDNERQSNEALSVALPDNNFDFNSLALSLSRKIVRSQPESDAALPAWQKQQRAVLNNLLREDRREILAIQQSIKSTNDLRAEWWWLRINGEWTVPAVSISKPDVTSDELVVLISDSGRFGETDRVKELVNSGRRVVAVDPFYFGESKISQRDFLFAILVDSTGHRPLGIQVAQMAAAAGWIREQYAPESIRLIGAGPRTSLIALTAVAAGADIDVVELHDAYGSLNELLERNTGMNQIPEAFCFGLLRHFDIPELVALAGPGRVRTVNPSDRLRTELQPLMEALPDSTSNLLQGDE